VRQPGSMEVEAVQAKLELTGRTAPGATILESLPTPASGGALRHRPTTHDA
jgi:hypothetical protein